MSAGLHTSQGRDLRLAAPPNPKGQMLHPLHTTTWSRIWGRQVLEEVCQGRSSGPRRKHSHLDACSHSALALSPSQILITTQPPPSLALRLGWTQRRKVHELGRLLSSTRDSGTGDVRVHTGLLAVAVTSFGAGHTLKGNRA